MCGLFGTFNSVSSNASTSKDREKFLSVAAYVSALRGTDGTGFCVASSSGRDSQIYKDPVSSWVFTQTNQYGSVIKSLFSNNIVMGHCRSKTIGPSSHPNTHPFRAGHIVLAHNGTLTDMSNLPTRIAGITDSEHIAINMAKEGEKETLEMLNGSYALTWYNEKNGTFNIARNDARPLYTAISVDKTTLYYMSDEAMLEFVLNNANITIDSKYRTRSAAVGTWYIFEGDAANKWKEQKFTIKKPPEVRAHYYYNGSYLNEDGIWVTSKGTGVQQTNVSSWKQKETKKQEYKKSEENTLALNQATQFKQGGSILIEVDNYYTVANGITLCGTTLEDSGVRVIAPKQKIKIEQIGDFFRAKIVGHSIKNGQLTIIVDDAVPLSDRELAASAGGGRCEYCGQEILEKDISKATKMNGNLIGECCKNVYRQQ